MGQRRHNKGNKKILRDKLPKLIDAANAVLRGKYIAIKAYIKKSHINNLI